MINQILNKIRIQNHIKKKFPNELLLMKGRHKTNNINQSILFFTVHRCASRYVTNILKKFAQDSDVTHIDIEGYFWRGGKLCTSPQKIYEKFGYIYSPFYGMDKEELTMPIPNLDDFKIILMLRDPRDVLTSYYFHHAFDPYHNPAQQEYIIARSMEAVSKSIDEWVLEKTAVFLERYKTYCEKLKNKPNVLFLKYEDMVKDFNQWLYNLRKFTGLNLKKETVESIIKKANFSVDKENVKVHKRQVTPGDHKRKLKKETINILNSQYSKILDILNYER